MQFFGKLKQRYQACNNRSKTELFVSRTKLSYKKKFSEDVLAIEMKKAQIFINEQVYLGLSILEIS